MIVGARGRTNMYLYGSEDFSEIPTPLQSDNARPGRGCALGSSAPSVERFGEPVPFFDPFPPAREGDPVVIAIRRLPEAKTCPAPAYARQIEQRIIEKLEKQGFSSFDIQAGLKFMRRELGLPIQQQLQLVGPPQATMRAAGPEEIKRSVIYSAQVLEELFLKAERSGDLKGMTDAAERYHELLNRPLPKAPEPMPGRGSMEKQRRELADLRAEILGGAPNLANIVRTVGPLDLARMQPKIREHVLQRVLLRAQRSRVRR